MRGECWQFIYSEKEEGKHRRENCIRLSVKFVRYFPLVVVRHTRRAAPHAKKIRVEVQDYFYFCQSTLRPSILVSKTSHSGQSEGVSRRKQSRARTVHTHTHDTTRNDVNASHKCSHKKLPSLPTSHFPLKTFNNYFFLVSRVPWRLGKKPSKLLHSHPHRPSPFSLS